MNTNGFHKTHIYIIYQTLGNPQPLTRVCSKPEYCKMLLKMYLDTDMRLFAKKISRYKIQDTFTNVSRYKIQNTFEYLYHSLTDQTNLDLRSLPNQGYKIGYSTLEVL